MTKFRPCIDLHSGQVKQIVGGTLTTNTSELKTNFVSTKPASYFAQLYRDNKLEGAHVIMLGPGNEEAATEALRTWPEGCRLVVGLRRRMRRGGLRGGLVRWVLFLFFCFCCFCCCEVKSDDSLHEA